MQQLEKIKEKVLASKWQAVSAANREHAPDDVPGDHCSYVEEGLRYWAFSSSTDLEQFLASHPRANCIPQE